MPTAIVELERDRALLDAFRAGRSPMLERVYYAYVDDVFRLVALGFATASGAIRPELGPDEQHVVVQEVFVRAFSDHARRGIRRASAVSPVPTDHRAQPDGRPGAAPRCRGCRGQ